MISPLSNQLLNRTLATTKCQTGIVWINLRLNDLEARYSKMSEGVLDRLRLFELAQSFPGNWRNIAERMPIEKERILELDYFLDTTGTMAVGDIPLCKFSDSLDPIFYDEAMEIGAFELSELDERRELLALQSNCQDVELLSIASKVDSIWERFEETDILLEKYSLNLDRLVEMFCSR